MYLRANVSSHLALFEHLQDVRYCHATVELAARDVVVQHLKSIRFV